METKKVVVIVMAIASLYALLASAEAGPQCSLANNNRTCLQKCTPGQPLCNLSCQAAPQFDWCVQQCTVHCDDVHCQDAHKCSQFCRVEQCGQFSCSNISEKCWQNFGSIGRCNEGSCTNSTTCTQDCEKGHCNKLHCRDAQSCTQNCWEHCNELQCRDAQSCSQSCFDGECDKLSCDKIGSCKQSCGSGQCHEARCTNSASCTQKCGLSPSGKCGQVICENATKCEQDCLGGNCGEFRCDDDVKTCKQQGSKGSRLHCSAESCEQTCRGDGCAMICSGNVKECSQTCNSGTCLVYCESANCKLECGSERCVTCADDQCLSPATAKPTSAGTPLAAFPGFIWLACFLLFNSEQSMHHASLVRL